MRRWLLAGSGAIAVLLTGCVPPPQAANRCDIALGPPMLMFDVFFGRSVPGRGDVSDREWHDFLDKVVTPNLPNGYTVFDAAGAWMNPVTTRTLREPSKVLMAALPENAESVAAVNRIRNAYQLQFRQQLVGLAVQPVCGSF